jgi:hypothetical protein
VACPLRRCGAMALFARRVTLVVLSATYLTGVGLLAGVAAQRVRADGARLALLRAQSLRQQEARERAIRVELQHPTRRATR